MQQDNPLLRTKLRPPLVRPGLVLRPRLQEQIAQGLRGTLTLITAPAGSGKTTLVASSVAGSEMPVGWLSLDRNDNLAGRFLSYLIAALQQVDPVIGREAAQLMRASRPPLSETILTSLVNELDVRGSHIALVLDDYQFISSQAVHAELAFLLEHCPISLHLAIATRSDPPLPLARLRARGQVVELRAADLRFTEGEATQFLNEVMGLSLESGSIAALAERTEGWIAGLQMAALSMRDREDVAGFIEGFSGTNRYIMDYLLEEVMSSQPPEIQHFLLHTSILERLSAPLCDAVVGMFESSNVSSLNPIEVEELPNSRDQRSNEILEYLDRANLFLVPLDDERVWYRYHHLFADLLRSHLNQVYPGLAPQLHLRAAAWFEQSGLILEAIQHASMASNDELVERLIEQHYMEMVNRGEMSWIRDWMGRLSKDLIYRRPWLCLYEALSRSWFGQLDEANFLLDRAEKSIQSDVPAPGDQAMLGYHAYVKSRVIAMQGDTRRAIEYCLQARERIPPDFLGLHNDVSITLGYEYFLYGDFTNADKTLVETIQSGSTAGAINNPVAAYDLLARAQIYQGHLHKANDFFQKAFHLIQEAGGQYLGVTGLVEVGIAALSYEWNDLEASIAHVKRGLDLLPMWGKTDDTCLAYVTLWRIHLALGNRAEAAEAIEKAAQLVQTCGLFSEARNAVDAVQVGIWLVQGDWSSINRWSASINKRYDQHDLLRFEDELTQITQSRIYLAQKKLEDAIQLLTYLEVNARSAGRAGRLIEIMILKALGMQAAGDHARAGLTLSKSLELAEPEGYVRVFLDEGRPMQVLLTQWLAQANTDPIQYYAAHLLSLFDAEPHAIKSSQGKVSTAGFLVEPLSQREVEVLQLIALGKTNQEIAQQLVISPGTVKAHTASIYRKLEVANRTEAAARARQLGLLP